MPINAVEVYEKLVKLDDESVIAHAVYARSHYLAGNFSQALEIFQHCWQMDANYLLSYLLAGQCCEKLGNMDQAKAIYARGYTQAKQLADNKFMAQFKALSSTI